jgi:hypothetical protein
MSLNQMATMAIRQFITRPQIIEPADEPSSGKKRAG